MVVNTYKGEKILNIERLLFNQSIFICSWDEAYPKGKNRYSSVVNSMHSTVQLVNCMHIV